MKSKKEKYTELAYIVLRNGKRKNPGIILSELSPSEFSMIDTILTYENANDGNKITVNKIAQDMGISAPAVSKSLKALEARGVIARFIDKSSRRNTCVCVTEYGNEIYEKNLEVIGRFIDKIISSFTDDEIEQLIGFSKKINMLLTETIDSMQAEL